MLYIISIRQKLIQSSDTKLHWNNLSNQQIYNNKYIYDIQDEVEFAGNTKNHYMNTQLVHRVQHPDVNGDTDPEVLWEEVIWKYIVLVAYNLYDHEKWSKFNVHRCGYCRWIYKDTHSFLSVLLLSSLLFLSQ